MRKSAAGRSSSSAAPLELPRPNRYRRDLPLSDAGLPAFPILLLGRLVHSCALPFTFDSNSWISEPNRHSSSSGVAIQTLGKTSLRD